MLKLGWNDLLVENVTPVQAAEWLTPWAFLLDGRVAPIFLNKFGSWFLQRPDGTVDMLDVLRGKVRSIASSVPEFRASVNALDWQEEHLLSKVVYDLHLAGKVPGPTQAYALAPHPLLGGPDPGAGQELSPACVMLMEMRLWQSICRQVLAGPTAA